MITEESNNIKPEALEYPAPPMNEINKDGITTRSIQYNWDYGDYTIRIFDKNRKEIKVYPSIERPYYPRIGDS